MGDEFDKDRETPMRYDPGLFQAPQPPEFTVPSPMELSPGELRRASRASAEYMRSQLDLQAGIVRQVAAYPHAEPASHPGLLARFRAWLSR